MTFPLARPPRAPLIDALRGLALLAVLWVNTSSHLPPRMDTADTALRSLETLVAHGKGLALLAFVFGLSFALSSQAQHRAESRRRLLGLALLGAAHLTLWSGDVLLLYAALGTALLRFDRHSTVALLRLAALSGALGLTLQSLNALSFTPTAARPDALSWLEALHHRLQDLPLTVLSNALHAPFVLALMLLGMALIRSDALSALRHPTPHLIRTLRSVRRSGAWIGVPLALAAASSVLLGHDAPLLLHAPLATPLAAALTAHLALRASSGSRFPGLERLGRWSLTLYLFGTCLSTALLEPYALNLRAALGRAELLLLLAALLSGFLTLPVAHSGPLERLLSRFARGGRARHASALLEARRRYGAALPALHNPAVLSALAALERAAPRPLPPEHLALLAALLLPISRHATLSPGLTAQASAALLEGCGPHRPTHPELHDATLLGLLGAAPYPQGVRPQDLRRHLERFRALTDPAPRPSDP